MSHETQAAVAGSCWSWVPPGFDATVDILAKKNQNTMLPLLHFPGQTGLPRLPGARCFIPFSPFIMLTRDGYRRHPVGGVLCVCETPESLRGFDRCHQALDPQWGVKYQYFMTATPLNLCQGRTGWSPGSFWACSKEPSLGSYRLMKYANLNLNLVSTSYLKP